MSKETSLSFVNAVGTPVPEPRHVQPIGAGFRWGLGAALLTSASGAMAEFDAQKYLAFGFGDLSLRPRLEIGETYDSNLFYEQNNPDADFITIIRPGFNLALGHGGDSFSSLTYQTDISRYVETPVLDYVGHIVSHEARIQLNRALITGSDSFTLSRSTLGGTFSYLQRPVALMSLRDQWKVDYDLSPKAMVGIDLGFEWYDYDAGDLGSFGLYDALAFTTGLRAGYIPSDRLVVFPQITYSHSELTVNQSTAADAPPLSAYGAGLGVQGEFSPKLTGTLSGGYEIRDYGDSTAAPDGWVSSVSLRWQPRAKTTVALTYRHWIQVARDARRTAFVADRPSLRVTQQLGTQGRWTVSMEGSLQLNDYGDGFDTGAARIKRSDELYGVSTSASFRWTAWLNVAAAYDFASYTDTVPGIPDYEVHRISLRLVAGY